MRPGQPLDAHRRRARAAAAADASLCSPGCDHTSLCGPRPTQQQRLGMHAWHVPESCAASLGRPSERLLGTCAAMIPGQERCRRIPRSDLGTAADSRYCHDCAQMPLPRGTSTMPESRLHLGCISTLQSDQNLWRSSVRDSVTNRVRVAPPKSQFAVGPGPGSITHPHPLGRAWALTPRVSTAPPQPDS